MPTLAPEENVDAAVAIARPCLGKLPASLLQGSLPRPSGPVEKCLFLNLKNFAGSIPFLLERPGTWPCPAKDRQRIVGIQLDATWTPPSRVQIYPQAKLLKYLAHRGGFEPPTPRFVVWCSIQLSYRCLWVRRACHPDVLSPDDRLGSAGRCVPRTGRLPTAVRR